jgi:Arc/MetJ-type ribon-helix-helix transcriptional regulator
MLSTVENLVDEMEFEDASEYLRNWLSEHPEEASS